MRERLRGSQRPNRVFEVKRLAASRTDSPSNRCSTITIATTGGGTERRPAAANSSANMLSGTSTPRCSCRNAKIESAGSRTRPCAGMAER